MNVQIEESWKQVLTLNLIKTILSPDGICSGNIRPRPYILRENWYSMLSISAHKQSKSSYHRSGPIPRPGQTHGLCFSVNDGIPFPPSLQNIFKEIHDDLGTPIPTTGNLTAGQNKGLAQCTLTLSCSSGEAHTPTSRLGGIYGYVIRADKPRHLLFILWEHMHKERGFIDTNKHLVLTSHLRRFLPTGFSKQHFNTNGISDSLLKDKSKWWNLPIDMSRKVVFPQLFFILSLNKCMCTR